MNTIDYDIAGKKVTYYFDASFSFLDQIVSRTNTILITDEQVYALHKNKLEGWKIIVVKAGEEHKQQSAVDFIIQQLIQLEADRNSFIIGIGGGVVTDITGFAAGIYMRGVNFAFIPTTILAMVDAAIGGKNGVDVGLYKNLAGLIRQPRFLMYDYSFLQTLPGEEWVNGFAEIIKHACIKDKELFALLENNTIETFQEDKLLLASLIEKNVAIKNAVVAADEMETGERKLLNFGHTFGHAIENVHHLPHGHAVSIGMAVAAGISEKINNFSKFEKERILALLKKYGLPVALDFDEKKVFGILKMDKKRSDAAIRFILLDKIGEAVIQSISLSQLPHLTQQAK